MGDERDGERDGGGERRPGPRRPARLPPLDQWQHHRDQACRDQRHPGQVQPGRVLIAGFGHQARSGQQRGYADRHVDPEDDPPAQPGHVGADEDAADELT